MLINTKQIQKAKQVLLSQAKPLLKNQHFYVFGLVTTLAILHLSLVGNHPSLHHVLSLCALNWTGIILLLWRYRQLEERTSWFSIPLGLTLLFWVILRPPYLWNLDLAFFILAPIIAVLGLVLLTFGFPGLRRQWRSFLILCLMLSPYPLANNILDRSHFLSNLTTAISAFLLHYIGLKATYHDTFTTLPTGQVYVGYGCTGGPLIVNLVSISFLLMLVLFPLTLRQKLGLVLYATCIGFIIGCFRVSLLAVVVNNHDLFAYRHGPTGSQIFLVLATLAYVVFCSWLLPKELFSTKQHHKQSWNSSNSYVIKATVKRRWYLPLLATTWMGVVFTAIYLVCAPTVSRRLLAYTFPDKLVFNSWQQVSVMSLSEQTLNARIVPEAGLVQSGKQYRYLKNSQQLELQILYAVNTRGEPDPFLSQSKGIKKENQQVVRQLNGVCYYKLITNGQQAYLNACINPRGGSTVTSVQFNHNRFKYDFTWSRILPWLLGKEILKDNRCLWVQLSTPLNKATASEAYQILETAWAANYTTWQSQIPPPL